MITQFAHPSGYLSNTNFIGKDGIIHNHYVGNQTVTSLKKAQNALQKLTEKLRKENKHVLVLTDISRLGKLNIDARMYAVEFIKTMDFDKVAIYGNHMIAEQIVNVIIMASGRGYKMKYFNNKTDALFWLSY